jgi:hypothetical protein
MTILQHSIAQAAAAGGYQIARSLRFNSGDSAYLTKTPASTSNQKTFTWSGWLKRGSLGGGGCIFGAGNSGTNFCNLIYASSTDTISWFTYEGSTSTNLVTTQVLRDPSAWHHIVLSVDTTQATSTNRAKLYLNGVQITAFGTATYPAQNTNHVINTTAIPHGLGAQMSPSAAVFFNGYMAEIYLIDGQQLDPTSFGETDTNTGIWNPKTYSGTYGTNGFNLKFADNSNTTAATLGKDSSSNANNWTPNNFSVTAGVGNDSLVDTPTNYGTDTGVGGEVRGNYCTLNPLDKGGDVNAVLNGNLDATWTSNNGHSIRSTLAVSSGKWYWEFTNVNNLSCGIIKSELKIVPSSGSLWPGSDGFGSGGSFAYRPDNGNKTTNSTGTSYGATFTTTDVIGCALDMDNGKIYWSKNGTWQASGDPAAGTNAAYTGISGTFSPAWGYIGAGNNTLTANFGQRPFAYTAPSGFKALCTQNLPTPAIGATSSTLASKNFDIATYTGTGSSLSVTSLAFQPDFTWIKGRSGATDHALYDAVRGVQKDLVSNTTAAETTQAQGVTAFGSTGFTVGTLAKLNTSSATYAAWNWKANGAGSSNTSGTITSTVSANTTAGISVVTYSGNGTAGATVGHGLGVAPAMVIVKSRTISPSAWRSYNKNLANAATTLDLNSTAGADGTNASSFNSTAPTSSVFSLGTSDSTNNSSATYVAYCFAEIAGFSKFGSYTGNGTQGSGPFVYTGFRPRYVAIKKTSSSGTNWHAYDSARSTYNYSGSNILKPDDSGAELTARNDVQIDILSNGFRLIGNDIGINENGGTFIYMAFAEAPFNYARAR